MNISADARALALLAAFWSLARALKARGVLDAPVFFGNAKSAYDRLLAEGEVEAAEALDGIIAPLFADWGESGGAGD